MWMRYIQASFIQICFLIAEMDMRSEAEEPGDDGLTKHFPEKDEIVDEEMIDHWKHTWWFF